MAGPKVRLGILWFLVALAAVVWGRWATTAVRALMAAAAALQVTRAGPTPAGSEQPTWAPRAAAFGALVIVGTAGIGTSAAGVALAAVPLVLLCGHALAGAGPPWRDRPSSAP